MADKLCGFKPSQYVDKRFLYTHTAAWKMMLLYAA